MPQVDLEYGMPTPSASPMPTPQASAAPPPNLGMLPNTVVAPSALTPPVPTYQTTPPNSDAQFQNDIKNSWQYKQQMENLDLWAKQQADQQAFDSEWAQKFFEQNKAQIAGSMPNYGAGEAQYAAIDALNKEKAAHDLANQQEYVREALGSRGLASSGQVGVDQGELTYNYGNLLKEIDLRAQARKASAAEAAANAQRSIQNQLADLTLRNQYTQAQAANAQKQLSQEIAARRGDALLKVADALRPYYFDPDTGAYIGPGGQVLTTEQAQATIDTSKLPAYPGTEPTLFAMPTNTGYQGVNALWG